MKHNTDRLQNLISSVFSFLLAIMLLLLLLIAGLFSGAFNDKVIKAKVNESNFYNETYSIIYDRSESILKEAGLPESILKDAITLQRVYIGGKYYVEDVLAGKEPSYKTDKLKATLEENIRDYLDQQNIEVTKDLEAGTKELTERIIQEYRRGIQFDFINSISRLKYSSIRIVTFMLPVIIGLILLISFLLFRMHKYKHRAIRYINYSVITASVLTGGVAIALLLLKIYNKVTVQPKYYNTFLRNYFSWDIKVYLYLAGLGSIAAILLFLLTEHMKNNISKS